jgi:putative transposase
MDEFQLRQVAVQRVLAGEKASIVSRSYGKSRKWIYLWLARFKQQASNPKWFEGESKAPKNKPTKIADTIEQRVL